MSSLHKVQKTKSHSKDESLDKLRGIVLSKLSDAGITQSKGKPGNGRYSSILSPRGKY